MEFVPAQRVTNNQPPEGDDYLERGPYAWIPYTFVEHYVEQKIDRGQKHPIDARYLPAAGGTRWFWPVWLGNMRKAIERDTIPWE